ncbi:MAG TPA: hypothetical protein VGB85_24645 [Nannocystis sp.]
MSTTPDSACDPSPWLQDISSASPPRTSCSRPTWPPPRSPDALRFPMIVKHPNSYGSVGMTRDARVTDRAKLATQSARLLDEFGGVLIEELIEGRELTVLVAENPDAPREPVAFVPAETPGSTASTSSPATRPDHPRPRDPVRRGPRALHLPLRIFRLPRPDPRQRLLVACGPRALRRARHRLHPPKARAAS